MAYPAHAQIPSSLWKDQAPRSESETAQAAILKQQLGVSKAQTLGELGHSPEQAVGLGQTHAEELALDGLGELLPGISVSFAQVSHGALQDLVGFLADGSLLPGLLDELGPEASVSIRKALIAGVATGQNPRVIARQIRQALGGNLVRALTIARTEVLRSYRESSRRSYQANRDVVKGWIWHSALGRRTCAACWAMHGTFHRLDERLDDHPRGRCAMVPVTKTWEELGFKGISEAPPQIEKGVDLFQKLTDAEKETILGKAGFQAYKAGVVKLEDFVGRRLSRRWGTMRYARSLRDILWPKEARKWQRFSSSLRPVGADVHKLAVLQDIRLNQLREMTKDQVDNLLLKMTSATELPELSYHFRRHGALLGATTEEEYLLLFKQHVRRTDLVIGTALRPKDRAKMWYLVGVDTKTVAQYNETAGRFWTFMRVANLEVYLRDAEVWWIRVKRKENEWDFEPWKT